MSPADLAHVHERLDQLEKVLREVHVYVVKDADAIDPAKAYSVKELAKLLGVSVQSVYWAMETGKLPTIETGTIRKRQARGRDVIEWRRTRPAVRE